MKKKIKKIKKEKKTKKSKNIEIDIYMYVLDEINIAIDVLKEKKNKNKINNYCYPILKSHMIIERNKEEIRQKLLEEKKKEEDKLRYQKERATFKEEDINIYKEEEDYAPKSNTESEESEFD